MTVEELAAQIRRDLHSIQMLLVWLLVATLVLVIVGITVVLVLDDRANADPTPPAPASTPTLNDHGQGAKRPHSDRRGRPSRPARTPAPTPTAASRGEQRTPLSDIHADNIDPKGTPTPPAGFDAWLASSMAHSARACESGMDYRIVDVNNGVTYYGAWQANEDFWRTYGGDPAYLGPAPFTAPRWMQDRVAYRGYLARGWQPWACA